MAAEVKLYTRKWCGYCTAAAALLDSKGVAYETIDCTKDRKTRDWLLEVTGRSTVPQIFIDGKSVGGYVDIRELDRCGELDRLLRRDPEREAAAK